MKVYLFQRHRSNTTHAVVTRYKSLGYFEMDRVFGGGFVVRCTGKLGEGKGVLSEVPRSTGNVTCKRCLKSLKHDRIRIDKVPKKESWPPKVTRVLDPHTRFLGIPG